MKKKQKLHIPVRTEVWHRTTGGELVVKAVMRNQNGTFQGDTNKTAEIPLKKVVASRQSPATMG